MDRTLAKQQVQLFALAPAISGRGRSAVCYFVPKLSKNSTICHQQKFKRAKSTFLEQLVYRAREISPNYVQQEQRKSGEWVLALFTPAAKSIHVTCFELISNIHNRATAAVTEWRLGLFAVQNHNKRAFTTPRSDKGPSTRYFCECSSRGKEERIGATATCCHRNVVAVDSAIQ